MARLKFRFFYFIPLLFISSFLLSQPRNGMYTRKDENGVIREKGIMKKKLREGKWEFYDEAGRIEHETEYHNGKREGAEIYFVNGDTVASTEFKNDIMCGESKRWNFANGVLVVLEHYDNTGQRTGKNYYWYDDGKPKEIYSVDASGIATEYIYEYTGGLKTVAHYKNGKLEGAFTAYAAHPTATDSITSTVNYINGLKEGPELHYLGGDLLSKEIYCHNRLCDTAYYYYKRNLDRTIVYKEGLKNGPEKTYAEGRLTSESNYSDSHLEGRQVFYTSNGIIFQENWFTGALLDSGKTYYTDLKHNIATRTYKAITPQGINSYGTTEYYPNGNIKVDYTRLYNFSSAGQLEGPYIEYYINGQKKSERTYVLDKIQGKYRLWNAKGVLLIDAYCDDNILHGPVSAYTNTGVQLDSANSEFDKTIVKYMSAGMCYHGQNMGDGIAFYYKTDSTDDFEKCKVYNFFPTAPPMKEENGEVFVYATEMPEFLGGPDAFSKYIQKNIRYPEVEKEMGIQGTVYISFVIDRKGNIQFVHCVKEIKGGPGLNKEAVRVIKSMPAWRPARLNGHAVNYQLVQPIKFVLQ